MTPGTVEPVETRTADSGAAAGNGRAGPNTPPTKRRSRGRRRMLLWAAAALICVGIVAWSAVALTTPAPKALPTATPQPPTAHGVVEPVARASIATMSGGVVGQLPVQVGQVVEPQQEVAQVTAQGAAELLVAPWRGTVTGVDVHVGDTLMPGTVVATIGDLSRYQVETTDVDEYLIAQIRPNQAVTVTVEALDGLELRGFVKSVALQQQQSASGATNYPVVIDLGGPNPNLRPGMTVRIRFPDQSS